MQPTQPTSMKLPLCIHIFFSTIFFLMQISLFSFQNSITLTLFYFKEAIAALDSDLTCCYRNCCLFHETLLKCGNSIKFTSIKSKNVWNKRYPSKS